MKKKTGLSWIFARVKREIPLLVLLTICNALFSVCTVFMAVFTKGMIDAAQLAQKDVLLKEALFFLGILVLQILLNVTVKEMEARVSGKMEMRLKGDLYSTILHREYSEITKVHTGELLTRLTADVTVVTDNATVLLPSFVAMLCQMISAFIVILTLDSRFALVLLAAGVLPFGFTFLVRGKLKSMHKSVQKTDGSLRAFLQETMENLLAVQVFGLAKKTEDEADTLQKEHYKAKLKRNHWGIFANIGMMSVFNFGIFFTLLWSGVRLCMGQITFGTLTALMQLVNRVQIPMSSLSGIIPKYYAMISSAERLMELENLPEDVPQNAQAVDETELKQNFDHIAVKDVSFAYGENEVLKHANLTVQNGEFLAVSGISGIGKSTLLKLLLGVLPVQSGQIDIVTKAKTYKAGKDTRPLFSYVPQGNLLLSGTIRENLRLIATEASDEDIEKALTIACAADFVKALPDGLSTRLLENGKGLSEGQLQRLSIARALLSSAPVLLLDEATSALDETTERALLQNLRALKNKTCILISHKKAALEICDRELRIEKGQCRVLDLEQKS